MANFAVAKVAQVFSRMLLDCGWGRGLPSNPGRLHVEPRVPTSFVVHRRQISSSSDERRLFALQTLKRNLDDVRNGFAKHRVLIGVKVNPV